MLNYNQLLINEPMYFYFFAPDINNRKFNGEIGIMTPKYLFDNQKFYYLDPILESYKRTIVYKWGMYNRDPGTLTRTEIVDAINIKLGHTELTTLPLFRMVPSTIHAPNMKYLLSTMRIFRLDLNNKELYKYIDNQIDWGVDKYCLNRRLNKMYYLSLSYDEYTKYYRDNYSVNDKLNILNQFNQIRIRPKEGYIPKHLVKDMTSEFGLYNPFRK